MKRPKPNTTAHIAWHPAFVEALQLELEDYRDVLEFLSEFQLTTEPLRIDCVIIKKKKDVVITKNIGEIFRDINILEFKSPGDYVSIADFYKVYAYGCLYSSLEKIPITSITISFVESRFPRELLDHLQKVRGYTVEKNSPGIYTVKGDILPIQLVDSRQLSADENLWLKSLRKQLTHSACMQIITEIARHGKDSRIKAYLNAIAQANAKVIKEAIKMSNSNLTIEQVLEDVGWIAKWEARGEERKAIAIAQNMINLGYPVEAIVSVTNLDEERVEELYKVGRAKESVE